MRRPALIRKSMNLNSDVDGFEIGVPTVVNNNKDEDDDEDYDYSLMTEANPIQKDLDNTVDKLGLVRRKNKKSHFGLSLKEFYRFHQLVYERTFAKKLDKLIKIDENFLVTAQFKRNFREVSYEEDLSETVSGITFFSRFDSGNLFRVYKVGENQFDLIIQNDMNSNAQVEWFQFGMKVNEDAPTHIQLNIVNLMKEKSLFQRGVQPVIKSEQLWKETGHEWTRVKSNVTYIQNSILRKLNKSSKLSYLQTLSFSIKLTRKPDTLFVAMNFPYSFEQLSDFIQLTKDRLYTRKQSNAQFLHLCESFLGRKSPYFKISLNKPKQIIVLLARQHPSETLSSYLIQYLTESLLFNEGFEFDWLKKQFTWIIVPMVNIDGVQVGNSRCDVGGYDLNRIWNKPRKDLHPSLWYIKDICKEIKKEVEGEIVMMLDLHSHSNKMNSFAYGSQRDPVGCRIFPLILDQLSHLFNLNQCVFNIGQDNSAGSVFFNENKCDHSYTIEVSCGAYDKVSKYQQHQDLRKPRQLDLDDLMKFSKDILVSIFLLFEGDKFNSTEYKITRHEAKIRLEENLEFYLNLNKDGLDSDSDLSFMNAILTEFQQEESPTQDVYEYEKGIKQNMKLRKSLKQSEILMAESRGPLFKVEKLKVNQIPTSPRQNEIIARNSILSYLDSKYIDKKETKKTLEFNLNYQVVLNSKNFYDKLTKQKVRTEYESPLNFDRFFNKYEPHKANEPHKAQEAHIQLAYKHSIRMITEYQEKIRLRDKIYALKHLNQLPIIEKTYNSFSRPKEKGTFNFSPYDYIKRVHSNLNNSTIMRKNQIYSKQPKTKTNLSLYLSSEQFEERELDPQSFRL